MKKLPGVFNSGESRLPGVFITGELRLPAQWDESGTRGLWGGASWVKNSATLILNFHSYFITSGECNNC